MKALIRAQSAPWHNGIEFYVASPDQKTRVKEIVLEEMDDGMLIQSSSFHLGLDQAQTLMDDLWHCGLRPTEGAGSAGALRATERHLEDMRTLVFKTIHPAPGEAPPPWPQR